MANETIKVLLMMALIFAIEINLYAPRIQGLWHRMMPRRYGSDANKG